MSEEDVERHLIRITQSGPIGRGEDSDDLRISLAGAQEKTALLWHNGGWMSPHGSTPTTHILKLPLGLVGHRKVDLTASVENEWLCMNLLAEFDLPVARTAILNFGGQKVLGVERFDRKMHPSGKWIMRLPQEDFCQALGVPPHLKYENDGGPGLSDLAAVLRGSLQQQRCQMLPARRCGRRYRTGAGTNGRRDRCYRCASTIGISGSGGRDYLCGHRAIRKAIERNVKGEQLLRVNNY